MDHSHMGHGGMDHGGHGGMAPAMCSMHMLFTWDTTNLCIVFRWWHVQTTAGLIFSLLGVVALAAGYEAIRSLSRRYETWVAKRQEEAPRRNQVSSKTAPAHIIKAALYAVQNFYAFMLMLVFMTYNGWVILSVTIGTFLGFILFGSHTASTKETACH